MYLRRIENNLIPREYRKIYLLTKKNKQASDASTAQCFFDVVRNVASYTNHILYIVKLSKKIFQCSAQMFPCHLFTLLK